MREKSMSTNLQLLINKFHNYIKYEKQYSDHTIKNYLIDLTQFKDNFDTEDISTITTTNLQEKNPQFLHYLISFVRKKLLIKILVKNLYHQKEKVKYL